MQSQKFDEEPLVCLRCLTGNAPGATQCAHCGAVMIMPDEDFGLTLRVSARTSVGQVRANNEDNVGVWAINGVVIGIVADGMGGAAAGEVASRLTVEAIGSHFAAQDSETGEPTGDLQLLSESDLLDKLRSAIHRANRSVVDHSQKNAQRKGMGTTSTAALIRGNRVLLAHVGDSAAYLADKVDGSVTQLTVDHSFVQALVASGHITQAQARYHPMKHVLYRALGQSLELDVDLYARTVRAGDRIVLCSDGLIRHIAPEEIAEIVLREEMPSAATEQLLTLVNERGAEDNATVIVITVEQAS
ncbi:MAG: Stp1/IreP family PP2C-type Ser/Thr phosphatase [Anaerolinea sp.]|nr:Stp1/IreP family PP2C-type Ser/Thr phosphatase [Anaerolinea sp.]MCC6976070.1 Stp1/IreP family PP2C-type Ser/Thr phosphatase [Anaerolineae bacterium]CAG0983505.1 PPM family protein phosphatase [Anaerolineae bacterium]